MSRLKMSPNSLPFSSAASLPHMPSHTHTHSHTHDHTELSHTQTHSHIHMLTQSSHSHKHVHTHSPHTHILTYTRSQRMPPHTNTFTHTLTTYIPSFFPSLSLSLCEYSTITRHFNFSLLELSSYKATYANKPFIFISQLQFKEYTCFSVIGIYHLEVNVSFNYSASCQIKFPGTQKYGELKKKGGKSLNYEKYYKLT